MKIFICVAVFLFVGSSFAAPGRSSQNKASVPQNVGTGFEVPTELKESFKRLTQEVEKSFGIFTKNFEQVIRNVDQVVRSTIESGFVNVTTWFVDIMGRVEFLTLADGSHFMTPVTSKTELEHEYRTVAIAVSKLLRNLKTMEHADKMITNATRKMVVENLEKQINEMKSSPEKAFRTILHLYIEALDHVFEADHEMASEYKKLKTEAKRFVEQNPEVREPLLKPWDKSSNNFVSKKEITVFLHDKQVLREAFTNKIFLKKAVKHLTMVFDSTEHKHYVLARALIQKAQASNFESKVNEVYRKALERASVVEHMEDDDDVIADLLFSSIEQALQTDQVLNREVEGMMKHVDISFDIGMLFAIDLAPL